MSKIGVRSYYKLVALVVLFCLSVDCKAVELVEVGDIIDLSLATSGVSATNYVVNSVVWCGGSDGCSYLAVGGIMGTSDLRVYGFDSSNPALTLLDSIDSGGVRALDWCGTGTACRYLVVGGQMTGTKELIIYSFDGSTLVEVTSKNLSTSVFSVAWCGGSDGCQYLAVGEGTNLYVYDFNSTTSTLTLLDTDYGAQVNSVSWCGTGTNCEYLAIGGNKALGEVTVYGFDAATETLNEIVSENLAYRANSVAWCGGNDGCQYLAVGSLSFSNEGLIIYEFDSTNSLLTLFADDSVGEVNSVAWCGGFDGCQYLAVGKQGGTKLVLYRFDPTKVFADRLSRITTADPGDSVFTLDWCGGFDGCEFLAVGRDDASGTKLKIYEATRLEAGIRAPLKYVEWCGGAGGCEYCSTVGEDGNFYIYKPELTSS